MKKITLCALLACGAAFAQQKSTGLVQILPAVGAQLVLDQPTSTATLTLSGMSDRWFALTFGSFGAPGAMSSGNDVVYYNGTTLVDARHNGQGSAPTPDAQNDWTVVSNTVTGSIRTIVATRSFTGGSGDFNFNFANNDIDLAAAHAETAISNVLQYHGNNRANMQNVSLEVLGVADNSLRGTQIYPNPSKGDFMVRTNADLQKVSVYTQNGAFVKSVEVQAGSDAEVNVSGLQTGIYLIELQSATEKTWKKLIVE